MWDFLKKENKKGKTILLTTHYIEEAERLCDEIAIINQGNIITHGKTEEIINDMGQNNIQFSTKNLINFKSNNFNWNHTIDDNEIIVDSNDPDSDIIEIINFLNSMGIEVNKVQTKKSTLEEIFIKLTNEK